MIDTISDTFKKGKQSLDSALREKAFDDVAESLAEKGININDIDETDLEELVAQKVSDMNNGLKGFATGGLVTLLLGGLF